MKLNIQTAQAAQEGLQVDDDQRSRQAEKGCNIESSEPEG